VLGNRLAERWCELAEHIAEIAFSRSVRFSVVGLEHAWNLDDIDTLTI
jgi:hypothetical protein